MMLLKQVLGEICVSCGSVLLSSIMLSVSFAVEGGLEMPSVERLLRGLELGCAGEVLWIERQLREGLTEVGSVSGIILCRVADRG